MTAVARGYLPADAALVVGDAEQLPLLSDRFDVILTSSSFHFWPHPREALRELRRILRKSGRLVVTDWCDDFIACRLCDAFLRWRHGTQQRALTMTECKALLQEAGFRVISIETYRVSWLWGLMTAVAER
jgi:ubiquinone/menaquinone biosynthesis C-methylase UbiE